MDPLNCKPCCSFCLLPGVGGGVLQLTLAQHLYLRSALEADLVPSWGAVPPQSSVRMPSGSSPVSCLSLSCQVFRFPMKW